MENRDNSPKEVQGRPVLAVPTPPEQLVGVAYDRTGKRLLLITEDYLINVLNTDVPQIIASFEHSVNGETPAMVLFQRASLSGAGQYKGDV